MPVGTVGEAGYRFTNHDLATNSASDSVPGSAGDTRSAAEPAVRRNLLIRTGTPPA